MVKKPKKMKPCTTHTKLSIVIPCFNEEGNLIALCGKLKSVLNKLPLEWEVILTNDGSNDATWDEITQLNNEDSRIKGVQLSRNFGHQYALFAGLHHATGDAVIMMDGDLQHPPEVIPELLQKWEEGYKIVNTLRIDPADISYVKKTTSKRFYQIFSLLSGVTIEPGMADFRLIDKQVVTKLLSFREEGLFLRGLVQWVGYPSTNITFQCAERFHGVSKYSLRHMITFAWHGISSFSLVPLRFAILIGAITSLISFAWLIEAVFTKLLDGSTVAGWASTVGILSFLFGILFIFLGIIGEYIGRILVQVRDRPLYIIDESVGINDQKKPSYRRSDN